MIYFWSTSSLIIEGYLIMHIQWLSFYHHGFENKLRPFSTHDALRFGLKVSTKIKHLYFSIFSKFGRWKNCTWCALTLFLWIITIMWLGFIIQVKLFAHLCNFFVLWMAWIMSCQCHYLWCKHHWLWWHGRCEIHLYWQGFLMLLLVVFEKHIIT